MSAAGPEIHSPFAEAPSVLAIGLAYDEAAARIDRAYVVDDVARAKLMRLVVKTARSRLRSGHPLDSRGDIETLAQLAVQYFLAVRSAAAT